jgi:hypothetical protein
MARMQATINGGQALGQGTCLEHLRPACAYRHHSLIRRYISVELGNERCLVSFSTNWTERVRWLRRVVTLIHTPYALRYILYEQRQPCSTTANRPNAVEQGDMIRTSSLARPSLPGTMASLSASPRSRLATRDVTARAMRCADDCSGSCGPRVLPGAQGGGLLTATRQHGRQTDTSGRCDASGGGAGSPKLWCKLAAYLRSRYSRVLSRRRSTGSRSSTVVVRLLFLRSVRFSEDIVSAKAIMDTNQIQAAAISR